MRVVMWMLFTTMLSSCGQKTEEDFVREEVKACRKECVAQGFDRATYNYSGQTFWCYCWHNNQSWGQYLYQKRWTGQ